MKQMNEMNQYQEFVSKSRYARYILELSRREDWNETTTRWVDYFKDKFSYALSPDSDLWGSIHENILNLKALPSMRSIMTAGVPLDRTNVAAYNCAYMAVDDPRSFDEAMYILLCGTGVGFSCESQYVAKLPKLPYAFYPISMVIEVGDSKEGWCEAYRMLIESLFLGCIPSWDVSQVRPAGVPLKTFGGRASGPAPLVDLFQYTVAKFSGAAGRHLTDIEVHDIMCKIGEVVVVGGVRRSAMISIGDLRSNAHAEAKSGSWWEDHPERALANNSAVYNEKPSVGEFMFEWLSIYNSHSGERGIFNREASQKQASKFGRRPSNIDYGTNPCSEIILRPNQFCNLSTAVVRPEDDLEALIHKIKIATVMGTFQSALTDFPYLRPCWKENTELERLLGVSMTGALDNPLLNNRISKEVTIETLETLREVSRVVNRQIADLIGVEASCAITCIKPEGTVSQLTLTASGLHTSHSPFYIRRVRQDIKDPLTQFMIDQGVPYEMCVMKPEQTVVFEFPMKANGLVRNDLTAIEHLDIWLTYQRHFCEHKPSVTISVKEHEWPEVGAWVFRHFDECTGVSFLPDDGGSYRQAPYEECTEEEFIKRTLTMPEINWKDFVEDRDNVAGVQTLACTADGCSI